MAETISDIGRQVTGRHKEVTASVSSPLVDGHTYSVTVSAAVADAAGNTLDGNGDGAPGGAFSRTFTIESPAAVGSEFRVNTTAGATQLFLNSTAAAADAAGDYVIAWCGSSAGPSNGIYAQLYTAAGAPRGGQITVSGADATTRGLAGEAGPRYLGCRVPGRHEVSRPPRLVHSSHVSPRAVCVMCHNALS